MLQDKIRTIFKDITNLQDVIDETKTVQSKYEEEKEEDLKDEVLTGYITNTKKIVFSLKDSVEKIHTYFDENFKEEEVVDKKPKVGMIKLVDLSKLIDPNRSVKLLTEPEDNQSIVVLSDSDDSTVRNKTVNNNIGEKKKRKSILKGRNNGLDTSVDKRVQFANNDTVILSKITQSSSSDSESEPEVIIKRNRRGRSRKNSESDSSDSEESVKKAQLDKKFSWKCTVRLPRISAEELRSQYMKKIADRELKRLTDWKSLKRLRTKNSDSSDSSGSDKHAKKKARKNKKKQSPSSDKSKKLETHKDEETLNLSSSDNEATVETSSVSEQPEKGKSSCAQDVSESINEFLLDSIVDSDKEKTDKSKKDKVPEKNKPTEKDSDSNGITENLKSAETNSDDILKEKEDQNLKETTEKSSKTKDTENSEETNDPDKDSEKSTETEDPENKDSEKSVETNDPENKNSEKSVETNDPENKDSEKSDSTKNCDKEDSQKSPEDKGDQEEANDNEGGNNSSSDAKENGDKKEDGDKTKKSKRNVGDSRGDRRSKKVVSGSDTSDSDDEKKKKKAQKKKKVIDDKDDEKKTEEDDEKKDGDDKDSNKSSESSEDDDKEDKSKWKKNKLLTASLRDSDEELEAFKKKKERLKAKENRSESDSDSPSKSVSKKKRTKKSRPKRVLSDSDSDKPPSDESESSSSESDDKNGSSDSEEERKKEEEKKKKRKRIKKVNSSSDEDGDKSTRKQIRRVMHKDNLAETTIQAEKAEAARKSRILEKQKKYNHIFEEDKLEKSTLDKVVLDFNEETREELLAVDKRIVKHLKPHQGKGVQFMWDACFESIDRAVNTAGSGCILAHCMGLGKTLQVITLVHTLISNKEKTGVEKVLVVCPLSTVLNWVAEFKKWLPDNEHVEVFDLVAYKQNKERIYQTMEWHRHGGVLVLGYDMFRNLTNENNKRLPKKLRNDFRTALVDPGPDMVVCDEGHLLKNEKTSLSISMNKLKTLRRIVLTGTPLQNNLKEYWCMVQFVKPNLLGTYKEYLNRFVNPIVNGQYTDSTQHDIQIMRKRSHVLHKMLDGVVQRRDYSVLAPFLPPKYEYVVFINLTETQTKLYAHYMREFARKPSPNGGKSYLFVDFQELQRIGTHPRVLLDKSIQNRIAHEKKMWENDEEESEGSIKDFIDDGSDAETTPNESSSGSSSEDSDKKKKFKRRTRATVADNKSDSDVEEVVDNNPKEWWSQYATGDELDNIAHSSKLHLLFEILSQCEAIGDKVLVFSQSLYSLNVIEYFLNKIDEATQNNDSSLVGGYTGSWALGLDYFRLDGSSSCDNRALWCKSFNDPKNVRARLFLISTRAGGLGINLVAANRVIIFDVSWNPSHDIQSIYRVYRFGQTKPSYIYRFVTLGTMEMKIYERQVTKQAISKRVIDEQQIDRHYNQSDLAELYKFEPEPEGDRPIPLVPKDILLGELLQNFDKLIYKYHEHQSLLENKEDEVLDEEERKAAWEEFENEKKNRQVTANFRGLYGNGLQLPIQTIMAALSNIVRREHPTLTIMEVQGVLPQVLAEFNSQMAAGESTMYMKVLTEIERMQQEQQQAKYAEYYKMQQQQQALKLLQKYNSGNTTVPQAQTPEFARYMQQLSQMNMQQQAPMMNMPQQQQQPSNSRRGRPPRLDPNEVVSIDD